MDCTLKELKRKFESTSKGSGKDLIGLETNNKRNRT